MLDLHPQSYHLTSDALASTLIHGQGVLHPGGQIYMTFADSDGPQGLNLNKKDASKPAA